MTGGGLLELILLSMGWLFFLAGLIAHYQILRQSLKAKPGDRVPSNMGYVPWPWFWIVLPLVMDPYCAGGLVLLALRK